jgi:hypothetical protein
MIESLEPRIAPALTIVNAHLATFTDFDGDLVSVKITHGDLHDAVLTVNEQVIFTLPHEQLQTLSFGGKSEFSGTDISITVVRHSNPDGRFGDGLTAVGYIDASGLDIGNVTVQGDLGRIDSGTNTSGTLALKSLSARTMGRYGLDTQATGGSLTSNVSGGVGAFKIAGDVQDAYLHVQGDANGTIGSVKVGGSLIGDAALTGVIDCSGDMGPVKIGRDVLGGFGKSSGAIQSDAGKIASVTIHGSLIGGSGQFSGEIRSSLDLGPVKIGGNVLGGSGATSGFIATDTTLGPDQGNMASITVGGSVLGGDGAASGLIRSSIGIGPVKIAHDLRGGSGNESGKIDSADTIGDITIGGSVSGGSGNQNTYAPGGGEQHQGQIFAHSNIGMIKVGHDVQGGSGVAAGGITADFGNVGGLHVGGSIIGGSAFHTGYFFGQKVGPIFIGQDVIGGSGDSSGAVQGQQSITSVTIGGSVRGGSNTLAGNVTCSGTFGPVKIGHDLLGGSAKFTGEIFGVKLASITIGGSVVGSGFNNTGEILIDGDIGSVKIAHDLVGGSITGSTPDVDTSGYVASYDGRIGSVFIGGSVISGIDTSTGGNLTNNATIRAENDIGSLIIKGSLVGHADTGNGASPVILSARGQETPTASSDLAFGKISIGGRVENASILAGYQTDLTPNDGQAQIGAVKTGRDFIASNIVAGMTDTANNGFGNGDDEFIGSPATTISRIASLTIGGAVVGSADSTTDHFGIEAHTFGPVKITGLAYHITPPAGLDFSDLTGNDVSLIAFGT